MWRPVAHEWLITKEQHFIVAPVERGCSSMYRKKQKERREPGYLPLRARLCMRQKYRQITHSLDKYKGCSKL